MTPTKPSPLPPPPDLPSSRSNTIADLPITCALSDARHRQKIGGKRKLKAREIRSNYTKHTKTYYMFQLIHKKVLINMNIINIIVVNKDNIMIV